mmetsp:Transcript_3369/g.12160  ORF Transcript_3369/g.12160 Transcript_3369/m.12160 type:complete len:227 (+) Transcript_3369:1283-1963(+)
MSGACEMSTSYQVLPLVTFSLHDSQLNPCKIISLPLPQGVDGSGRDNGDINGVCGAMGSMRPAMDLGLASVLCSSTGRCDFEIVDIGTFSMTDVMSLRARSRAASAASIAASLRSNIARASARSASIAAHGSCDCSYSLRSSVSHKPSIPHVSTSAYTRSICTNLAVALANSAATISSCDAINRGSADVTDNEEEEENAPPAAAASCLLTTPRRFNASTSASAATP